MLPKSIRNCLCPTRTQGLSMDAKSAEDSETHERNSHQQVAVRLGLQATHRATSTQPGCSDSSSVRKHEMRSAEKPSIAKVINAAESPCPSARNDKDGNRALVENGIRFTVNHKKMAKQNSRTNSERVLLADRYVLLRGSWACQQRELGDLKRQALHQERHTWWDSSHRSARGGGP